MRSHPPSSCATCSVGRLNVAAPQTCRAECFGTRCQRGWRHAVPSGPALWPSGSCVPCFPTAPDRLSLVFCLLHAQSSPCHFSSSYCSPSPPSPALPCTCRSSRACTACTACSACTYSRRTRPRLCPSGVCPPPPFDCCSLSPLVSAVQQGCAVPTWRRTSISRRLLPPVMASLSFIMDVTDDSQTEGRPPLNKRDRGPNKPASAGPLHEPPPSNPQPDPNHASSPGLALPEQDIKRAVPAGQIKRRSASLRGPKSSSTAPTSGTQPSTRTGVAVIVSPSSSPSLSTSTARPSTSRRRSTASIDSMDRSRYGSVPSSSVGGGLQRPVPPYPATSQYAPKITPKTGRVSKAKKGLPVHICDICRPPKVRTSPSLPTRVLVAHED